MMAFLGSRWFLSFIGVAILAVLVWFFGPLLAVLDGWIERAAVIAVLVMIWGLVNFLIGRRKSKAEDALVKGAAQAQGPSAGQEEVAALGDKLVQALNLLKK